MYVLHCKHYCSSYRADIRCVWSLPQQIWPSSFLIFVFTPLFFLFFLLSMFSCLFPFLFLFPDWMNLCSVLFLPFCLSHNTLGQGWSILYITSVTQRGIVTSTKSFTLCMVTWREWTMHDFFVWFLFLKHGFIFFPHIHIQNNIQVAWDFFFFWPKPPIWSPNVSVHLFLRGLWLLWLSDLSLLWWSYSVYWCFLRDPLLLLACFQRLYPNSHQSAQVNQGLNISNIHTSKELAHSAVVLGPVTAQGDAKPF